MGPLQLLQVLLLLRNSFELHAVSGQNELNEDHEEEDPAEKVESCVLLLNVARGQVSLHVDGELLLHVEVVSVSEHDGVLLDEQLAQFEGVIGGVIGLVAQVAQPKVSVHWSGEFVVGGEDEVLT